MWRALKRVFIFSCNQIYYCNLDTTFNVFLICKILCIEISSTPDRAFFFISSLESAYLSSKMKNIANVSNFPINSQSIEMDTSPTTCLKTRSKKFKLFFQSRKLFLKKKKTTSLEYEFENSPSLHLQEGTSIPPHESDSNMWSKSKPYHTTSSKGS
jgi:hypothetical protein